MNASDSLTAVVLSLVSLFAATPLGWTQTAPTVGLHERTPTVHALVGGRFVTKPGKVMEKGTVIIRDGLIEKVGEDIKPPADARIWNVDGETIYPGLIESYSDFGLPKQGKDRQQAEDRPDSSPSKGTGAVHWNPNARPERLAADLLTINDEVAEKYRSQGFTAVLSVPAQGVLKGQSALVSLGKGEPRDNLIKPQVAQHIALAVPPGDHYPNSLMGAVALVRQTFMDACWYQQAYAIYQSHPAGLERPEMNLSLEALEEAASGKQPVAVEVEDELGFLRAEAIAKEQSLALWVRGSGYEYRRLAEVGKAGVPIILPIAFPETPKVDTPEQALDVSLEQLRHWHLAPENPRRLHEAGMSFTLTSHGLKDVAKFREHVRKAMERGLPEEAALAALTTTPAKLFEVEDRLGTIEPGMAANLVITDGRLFGKKTKILDVWVDGKRYEATPRPEVDPRGTWTVQFDLLDATATVKIKGELEKLKGTIASGTEEGDLIQVSLGDRRIALMFPGDLLGLSGRIRMTGRVEKETLQGAGELGDGRRFLWRSERVESFEPKEEPAEEQEEAPPEASSLEIVYPEGAFGRPALPERLESLLVQGGTVWTCGPAGRLEEANLLIQRGKVKKVGKDLQPPRGATVIDARGKHVTPGVIDCHSHLAITRGTNESRQAISAEVRIRDVINSNDIGFYRQLGGGVTTTNILHGSSNPIGGHNAVVKLRWGALPEEMLIEDAPEGIKFALGENVKQSNWDRPTNRYPQTRMGVEEIIRDAFRAAQDYRKARQQYEQKKRKGEAAIPPRCDLELDALVDVLEGRRLLHCHAYRQDEMLMLVRLADEIGFRVATFQHVLEGYKVADLLAERGIGASIFSDWWAYKFEVYDAIPYNGPLMHKAGVLVSLNSDSRELARRLHTEAAKAIKYGGLSEEEALKLVTLNPAKQLGIDHRVGSLEPGKDADFVIWSGSPLSTYTLCEQTWIDGRRYFDREEDLQLREKTQQERAALIQKILREKQKLKKEQEEKDKNNEVQSQPGGGA